MFGLEAICELDKLENPPSDAASSEDFLSLSDASGRFNSLDVDGWPLVDDVESIFSSEMFPEFFSW